MGAAAVSAGQASSAASSRTQAPLQIPGAINAYCALLAEKAGFKALYLSGAGVANASFGLPDLGVTTLGDVLEDARRITAATELPLLVDVDTGFGSAFNIARTVREMERAGVAAIHLEDQEQAKRCGHRPNKATVAVEEMCDRLKAAVDARRDGDFVIMARTDAFAREGRAASLERAAAYVEAGADMIFAEALYTLDDYAAFTRAIDVPVLANLTEFGLTPQFTVAELEEGRRQARALSAVGVPRDEPRRVARLRDDSPRRNAARRARRNADARRAVRRARLSHLRAQARRAVREEVPARERAQRASRCGGAARRVECRARVAPFSAPRSCACGRRQRRIVDELERRVVAEAEQIERIVLGRRRGLRGCGA